MAFTVLLVVDDLWDVRHEKPLMFLEKRNGSGNASRCLVTSRIRGH